MISIRTIIKILMLTQAMAGTAMILMSSGVIPMDEKMGAIATMFGEPIGATDKQLLAVLGPAKILGVAGIWGYGPLPATVGVVGLMISATCAIYGHHAINDTVVPPLVFTLLLGCLLFLKDGGKEKGM